jgi:hypothetical protein
MKVFGIKQIKVNNTIIHTYNVMIKSTEQNMKLVKTSGLDFNNAYTRQGDKIQLTFTSMNASDFEDKVYMLGHLLKAVALNNLTNKYNRWVK